MKNLLKKLVLGILVATIIITAIPTQEAKASVKAYTKHKQLWVNLDKITPEKYVSMLYKYGKKGIKERTHYCIGFKFYAKNVNEDTAVKKMNAFTKKCMKVKQNKYGLSFGLMYDDCNSRSWNEQSGNTFKCPMWNSANDCVYMEQIVDEALSQKYITVEGWDKNGNWTSKTALTKDLFPTVASFRNASDSVKLQVVATYMGKNCMFYASPQSKGDYLDFSFEGAASKGKCFGVCRSFAGMYREVTRMICYINERYTAKEEKNNKTGNHAHDIVIGLDEENHALMIAIVKNSKGGYDMFEGNNWYFLPISYSQSKYDWIGYFENAHKKYPEIWSIECFYNDGDLSGKKTNKALYTKHNTELFDIVSAMNKIT